MTKYMKHTKTNCTAWNLFTVAEGVQCGNCLSLVIDNRPDHASNRDWNISAESKMMEYFEDIKYYIREGFDAEHAYIMAGVKNSTLPQIKKDEILTKARDFAMMEYQ